MKGPFPRILPCKMDSGWEIQGERHSSSHLLDTMACPCFASSTSKCSVDMPSSLQHCHSRNCYLIRPTPQPPVRHVPTNRGSRDREPIHGALSLCSTSMYFFSIRKYSKQYPHCGKWFQKLKNISMLFFDLLYQTTSMIQNDFYLLFFSHKGCSPWKRKTLSLMAVSHQAGSDPSDTRSWYASRCHHKILQHKHMDS